MGHRTHSIVVALAAVAALAMPGAAEEFAPAARASALCRDGKAVEAAALLGDAAAAAHRTNDVATEARVAAAISATIARVRVATPDEIASGKTGTNPARASLLAEVLKKLDASHAGSFVSAPALARSLVLDACETGDRAALPLASKVLAAHVKSRKAGAACALYARLATALSAIGSADAGPARAAPELAAVIENALENRWPLLAAHAATELAAVHVALGNAKAGHDVLVATIDKLDAGSKPDVLRAWTTWLAARVKDLPPAVTDRVWGGSGAGAAGGAGGAGANATGREPVAPYATWLKKADRSAPAVRAILRQSDWEIRLGWDDARAASQPVAACGAVWSKDGVSIQFAGCAAWVRALDPTGRDGAPGANAEATPWEAVYEIAANETFAVLRDGAVTVTAK